MPRIEQASDSPSMTMAQVCVATQSSRSMIYARLNPNSPYADPAFPKPFRLSDRSRKVLFVRAEVEQFLARRAAMSRQPTAKAS